MLDAVEITSVMAAITAYGADTMAVTAGITEEGFGLVPDGGVYTIRTIHITRIIGIMLNLPLSPRSSSLKNTFSRQHKKMNRVIGITAKIHRDTIRT